MVKANKSLNTTANELLQLESITTEDGFEYVIRLLAKHAKRLQQESNARVLAIPHWREPGDHFVSALMFLNKVYLDRGQQKGVLAHGRAAVDAYRQHDKWPEQPIPGSQGSLSQGAQARWYEPEYLLRYYLGNDSPLIPALHHQDNTCTEKSTKMSFQQAHRRLHKFILDTRHVTLWTINDSLDEAMLLLSQFAGFERFYEPKTCLPLYDVLGTNKNRQRQRWKSADEALVAGMGRRIISPASATLHPLIVEVHKTRWNQEAITLAPHLTAMARSRQEQARKPVSDEIKRQRKAYKIYLQFEKFGKKNPFNKLER